MGRITFDLGIARAVTLFLWVCVVLLLVLSFISWTQGLHAEAAMCVFAMLYLRVELMEAELLNRLRRMRVA